MGKSCAKSHQTMQFHVLTMLPSKKLCWKGAALILKKELRIDLRFSVCTC